MKTIYDKKTRFKLLLMVFAGLIVVASTFFSNRLANKLSDEERKKVELWAEAYKMLAQADESVNLDLILKVFQNNTTTPMVVLIDNIDSVSTFNNIRIPQNANQEEFLIAKALDFAKRKEPIQISTGELGLTLYYDDSVLLKQLSYFPYIQLGIIAFFFLLSYLAFSFSKQAEENQVWVGLSKETAHQLGTPLSALMAWVELMQSDEFDKSMIPEMVKDVHRLEMVTERFSKIGSVPTLETHNLVDLLREALAYMRKRTSDKIEIALLFDMLAFIPVRANRPLFEWVVENICKNAIDATEGRGRIEIMVEQSSQSVNIDFTDNGKGIPRKRYKTIFNPGFTTKKRGWGLGLSLTRRIVEQYHNGRIYVRWSEINKGTTIRITLPVADKQVVAKEFKS